MTVDLKFLRGRKFRFEGEEKTSAGSFSSRIDLSVSDDLVAEFSVTGSLHDFKFSLPLKVFTAVSKGVFSGNSGLLKFVSDNSIGGLEYFTLALLVKDYVGNDVPESIILEGFNLRVHSHETKENVVLLDYYNSTIFVNGSYDFSRYSSVGLLGDLSISYLYNHPLSVSCRGCSSILSLSESGSLSLRLIDNVQRVRTFTIEGLTSSGMKLERFSNGTYGLRVSSNGLVLSATLSERDGKGLSLAYIEVIDESSKKKLFMMSSLDLHIESDFVLSDLNN